MDLHFPGVEHQFQQAYPSPHLANDIYQECLFYRLVEAYRFFYPTVATEAIFHGNRELGIEDGKGILLAAAQPRHVALTANSDTPYAAAALDLQAMGPTV